MMTCYLRGILCCLALCMFASAAAADPRFVLVLERQQAAATLDDQIRQVLPQLWDRVLPIAGRNSAPFVKTPALLLQRVQRGQRSITLEMNEQAVWQLLEEQGIPGLKTIPRFRLNIALINRQGKEMTNSQRLLAQQAALIARRWGILLDPAAATVNMRFTWLDPQQVSLHISGSALLSDIDENRRIRGDSFAFLVAWMKDNMLQLRDTLGAAGDSAEVAVASAAASDVIEKAPADQGEAVADHRLPMPPGSELLVVRRTMSLSQQLMLEKALQQEQRVKALIPMSFSQGEQRYALQLKTAAQAWLTDWFAQHGMQATRLDGAWLIQ